MLSRISAQNVKGNYLETAAKTTCWAGIQTL